MPGARRLVRRSANVWEPEDPADRLYYAEAGRIKITRLGRDGSESLVETVNPADFFGELCFVGGATGKRETIATALDDCSIVEFSVAEFYELASKNSGLLRAFIKSLSKRRISAEHRITVLSGRKVEGRLGRVLLELAKERGIRTNLLPVSRVKIFVTHGELADLTAASRQRITKTMNRFREIGLVVYERTEPLVIDIPALEAHLENPE